MKYQIDHDYHIHSRLSPCAGRPPEQSAENILAYGKRMGMKDLIITDHFWDAENIPPMENSWFKRYGYPYIEQILPFPEDADCRMHLGCEVDMDLSFRIGLSDKLYDKLAFIIVATSHLHAPGWTLPVDNISVADRAALYMERNHKLLDADMPFHKVGIAHFTTELISSNSDGTGVDIINHITDAEYREMFSRAAAKGVGIELNMSLSEVADTANLRPYRIAKECGCKFYLGSDAHVLRNFDNARARFEAMINALELTEDDKFRLF